ncbi:MAG: hypothetical protein ACREQ5_23475, partial [Candidatus Dormibacteria bacterium]
VVLGAPPLGLRGERDLPADAGPPAIFPSDEPTDGAAFDARERVPLAVLADDVTSNPRFIVAVNPTTSAISITDARLTVGGRSLSLPELDLAPRDARVFPVELAADDRSVRLADDDRASPPRQPATIVTRADALPIRAGDPASDDPAERPLDFASTALATFGSPPSDAANARLLDVYEDGAPCVVLQNDRVRVIISPQAGARAFVFERLASGTTAFTTVGAMRDDVAIEPPVSPTDYIAKYTHQFPAGTFNRPYAATIEGSGTAAVANFRYAAPDVLPHGARFDRTVRLEPHADAFTLREAVRFDGGLGSLASQRAISVTSLAVGASRAMRTQRLLLATPSGFGAQPFAAGQTIDPVGGNALGLYDVATHELATIAWRAGDIERTQVIEQNHSIVVRSTEAPDREAHLRYGYTEAATVDTALRLLAQAAQSAQG